MPQKALTKVLQLCLNETTLFKLQVRSEKQTLTCDREKENKFYFFIPPSLSTDSENVYFYIWWCLNPVITVFQASFGSTSFGI